MLFLKSVGIRWQTSLFCDIGSVADPEAATRGKIKRGGRMCCAGVWLAPSCIFGSNFRSFTAANFATALIPLRARRYWQDYDAANPKTHVGRDLACMSHI